MLSKHFFSHLTKLKTMKFRRKENGILGISRSEVQHVVVCRIPSPKKF